MFLRTSSVRYVHVHDTVKICKTHYIYFLGIGQCKDEGNFANGRKIFGGTRENDTVNFVCNEEYLLIGNRQLHCSSDGNWNGSWPQCAIGNPTN